MQHQLRILPEALPEVPRDSKRSQFQEVEGPGDRRFDDVYRQQVEGGRDDSLAQQDQAATDETAKTGNTKPPEYETGGVKPEKPAIHETGGVKPEKPTTLETGGFKPSKGEGKEAPTMEGQTAPINGEDGSRQTIDPAMEHLLAFIEKSDEVLKNPQSVTVGEANGVDGNQLLKQNKLSAAIESALAGDHKDLKSMLEAFATELEKLSDEGSGTKVDLAGSQKQLVAELKQLLQTAGDGPVSLKDLQNADLSKELKAMLNDALQGGVKSEVMPGQTPGINPHGGANSKLQQAMIAAADKQTQGQTPPITNGENVELVVPEEKLQAGTTPGINPYGSEEAGKVVKHNEQPVEIKPTVRPAQAQAQAQQQKPMELEGETTKPDLTMQTPGQTPDINPAETEGAEVTKPMVVANDQTKPNVFSQDGIKPAKPETTISNEGVATKPMEKADPVLSSMVAENAQRDNKNILGTADKAKSTDNVVKELQSSSANTVDGDEAKLADESSQEQTAEQGHSDQQKQMVEEKLARSMPKDLANILSPKSQTSSSGFVNNLTNDNLSSLNALQQSEKAAAKLPPQLTEAINITKPDFSANMKERMTVMMNKGIQTADIRLDPAELGQMQVKMSVENDVTSVSFVVQNAQAKEMLEQAMPKLKDMLAEQGIDLGEGSVHQESQEQPSWDASGQEGNGGNQHASHSETLEQDVDPVLAQQVKIAGGALGGIDFFA